VVYEININVTPDLSVLLFQPLNTLRQINNVTPFDFSNCSHLVVKDVIHNKTRFVFNIQNNEFSGV